MSDKPWLLPAGQLICSIDGPYDPRKVKTERDALRAEVEKLRRERDEYKGWRESACKYADKQDVELSVMRAVTAEILAALRRVKEECPCNSGGYGLGGFLKQPCAQCDRIDEVLRTAGVQTTNNPRTRARAKD